jgi:chromosome segregation ATPase
VKADEAGIEKELMYEIGKTKRENESLQDELSTKEMILNNLQEELHELRASEKLISERFTETEQALFTKAEESERLEEQVAILKAELADQNEERERLLSVIQERSAEVSVLKNKNEAITGEKQHLEVHTVGELEQTKEAYQKISNEFNLLRERYVELERAYQHNDIKLKEETKFVTHTALLTCCRELILKQQRMNYRQKIQT